MLKNTKQTNHRHPEFISGSTRHCEQSEAISSRLPRATALAMTNETGRSMVEMLGVLAVIGVLSITGISGYTTAMNKHRANEILDAASKRAVVVSTQLQSGRTNPTLAEFGDDTVQGVAFGTPATVGDNQFKLPLDWTGISDEDQQETLCEYMQQYISEDGTNSTAQIDDDCARIIYNNDLSTGVTLSNNSNYDTENEQCQTGYYGSFCENACTGNSKVNSAGTGCECNTGYAEPDCTECDSAQHVVADDENGGCKCVAGYHKDSSGACVNTCTSWTTNECGSGYYCQFSLEGNGCTAPTSGVCKDITACGMGDVSGTNFRHSNYSGECNPDWWTAQAICKADGGRTLVSLSNIGCKNTMAGCTSTTLSSVRSGGFNKAFWTTDQFAGESCAKMYLYVGTYVGASVLSNNFDVLCQ